VTRGDLPPGAQICQAVHAALAFAVVHRDLVDDWYAVSNTLVVLITSDELSLGWLRADAEAAGLRAVGFHEPDMDGALTAVALEPAARRLLSHLPLALSRREEVKK
jgi:hypothetical protein